jgi:hypothetical protein
MNLTILLPIALWLWQVTSQDSGNAIPLNPLAAPDNSTAATPMVTQVFNVLNPINNPAWNGSSINESIALQQSEQFLWGSHGHNSNFPFNLSTGKY